MLFNSLEFLLFLPLVLLCYYVTPFRFRVFLLLLASYYFYMRSNPVYILLIIVSTLIDYSAGLMIERTNSNRKRKLYLTFSLLTNLGLLIFFKYINFILSELNAFDNALNLDLFHFSALDIILPVGISFYTFQTMSYTIDVYRRQIHAEPNLAYFALYVSFFPQLVAGPIERFQHLIGQFKQRTRINEEQITTAFQLLIFGFFLKMVVADNIGIVVDSIYSGIPDNKGNELFALLLYPFQIYCDFYGYSTIAVGTALFFNVRLMENFRAPFFTSSITEFWRKWHISLSTWFRDYLYFSLGGNRGNKLKWIIALLIVFLVSGAWHGASRNFVLWGLGHAVVMIVERLIGYHKLGEFSPIVRTFKIALNFLIVACLFVLFRSPNLATTKSIFLNFTDKTTNIFQPHGYEWLIYLLLFIGIDFITRKLGYEKWLFLQNKSIRWIISAGLLFLILSRSGTIIQPFIYFQF